MRRFLLLLPLSLGALETKPWLGEFLEFEFQPAYTYSRFTKVEGARPQIHSPYNVQVLSGDLTASLLPELELGLEAEFADTPRQAMGWRSAAVQIRYQFLSDIAGDPVSLVVGGDVRGVSGHSLRDVSCPYAAHANGELSVSVGKEWDHGYEWKVRGYGFGAVGQGNQGRPWASYLLNLETQQQDRYRFGVFMGGVYGFGSKEHVNPRHFHGYGNVHHQSLDAGVHLGYQFEVWGRVELVYAHRFYAKAYPRRVNSVGVSYTLPFSFF